MKRQILWVILLLMAMKASSQERLLYSNSCNYTGELSPVEDIYSFASDSEADDAMRRIMRYTGLPANFMIKAANVPNAAAVLYQDKRFILYNQYFMVRIKDETKTDWAALSILAHEIGHHLSGHTLDNQGSRPDKELEADRFSGFILYKMGATLEEARIAMDALASETGTPTHPPKSARLAAVTNGFLDAKTLNEAVKPIGGGAVTDNSAKPVETVLVPKSPAADPQKATAGFKKIWMEQNVEEKGKKGLRIHAAFNVSNLLGETCRAVAWFYDKDSGEPLEDFNGMYSTSTGDVSVGMDFEPKFLSADFTDLPLFIPYEEFHLEEGDHNVKFQIGLFHQMQGGQMQQVGTTSTFSDFNYRATSPLPNALYRKLWVDFGVYEGIQKGMLIHMQFNIKNLKEKPCRAVAWFYFDSGLPLLDYNGRFNTSDGKVSVGLDFSPQYDSSDFHDFTLFMPYDELHLSSGEHSLKMDAGLLYQKGSDYVQMGEGFEEFPFIFSK